MQNYRNHLEIKNKKHNDNVGDVTTNSKIANVPTKFYEMIQFWHVCWLKLSLQHQLKIERMSTTTA